MRIGFEVKQPMMPNFILVEAPAGNRQDGFDTTKNSIPVEQLTEKQALEYAEIMKKCFMTHYRKKVADARRVQTN